MIPALINLIVVLLVAAVLYWALGRLWPLTGTFGSSPIGQVIYVILIVIGALYVVLYGVVPVIQSIPGGGGAGHFRWGWNQGPESIRSAAASGAVPSGHLPRMLG